MNQLEIVKNGSYHFNDLTPHKIDNLLLKLADAAENAISTLLVANEKDLAKMPSSDPKYDRLRLTEQRIKDIANDIRNVSKMPSPLGKKLVSKQLPNGLELEKVSVPLGVIGIIYEARPNVTFDVFSLCFKSGNACILKGGSDAEESNKAIIHLIHSVLEKEAISTKVVQLLPADRTATIELLEAVSYVDIIIPRGSQGLINYVRENAKVPVIETGAGIVHTYYDKFADFEKGMKIIVNAKTRRVSVCNALDCLIIHENRLQDLPSISKGLLEKKVTIFADDASYNILESNYPTELLSKANEESFGTEFLSHKMSIKTVASIKEATEHIRKYSSKHSEAIVSEDPKSITYFINQVDAAVVYANASTAFTDGAQFGLGAEIGISTQKLHARGPMALDELCSYKWIIKGDGHVRT